MSIFHDSGFVTRHSEAEEACAIDGGRLWQPRTYEGHVALLAHYSRHFYNHMGKDYHYAIGLKARMNAAGEIEATYPDGVLAPKKIVDEILADWHVQPGSVDKCVYLFNFKFTVLDCDGPAKGGKMISMKMA